MKKIRFVGLVLFSWASAAELLPHPTDSCGAIARESDVSVVGDSVSVPAQHGYVYYLGRVDCSNPEMVSFAFPAVSVSVNFEGTGFSVTLNDYGSGTEQGTNYFQVEIDGGEPVVFATSRGQTTYPLAENLAQGKHSLVLTKRSEALAGKVDITGFTAPLGTTFFPVASKSRRLEFVGDSITAGYGNEISVTNPNNYKFTTKNSNATKSFGAITAKTLGAEYVAVAVSGRGISRNYGGEPGALVPNFYDQIFPNEYSSAWNPQNFRPDAVIINVGTNDFSPGGVDRKLYVDQYTLFLNHLRALYPDAKLVLCVGPMLSDSYPAGELALSSIREDIQSIVIARKEGGDKGVYYVDFGQQSSPFGEDWHPTIATHQQMADMLVETLMRVLKWE